MIKLIGFGVAMGIGFVEAGNIREATFRMAQMAAEAQQHDMISLG